MFDDQASFERIERYIRGELSGPELEDFERELAANPDLASEVRLHSELAAGLGAGELADFRSKLVEAREASQPSAGRKAGLFRLRPGLSFAIAALLLLAIAGPLLFMQLSDTTDHGQLFAAHFEAYPALATKRSEQGEDPFAASMQAYEAGRYAEAESLLEVIFNADPQDSEARFYLAVSQLAQSESAAALTHFTALAKSPESLFAEQSDWYAALAHLQQGDIESTRVKLQAIVAQGGAYAQRSAALLTDLE